MINFITDGQKQRNKDIDNMLKHYEEFDIPDSIIHKINKKFKSTKNYDFIRTEQIEIGMMIRVVDLDINNISTTGIVVKLIKTSSKQIGNVMLYNSSNNIYWKINPDKYYIFHIEKGTTSISSIIREYRDNNINKT
jgi:hypothetical protein